MEKTPFKSFGFSYKYEGSNFVFHIVASSEEEAIGRAQAMAGAKFEGEMKLAGADTDIENRAHPLWCALAGEIRKQAADKKNPAHGGNVSLGAQSQAVADEAVQLLTGVQECYEAMHAAHINPDKPLAA